MVETVNVQLFCNQMQMLLELKNINYKYPGSTSEVFQNLNCAITTPGFHALFGPSGVGTSDFIRTLARTGLSTPGSIDAPDVTVRENESFS